MITVRLLLVILGLICLVLAALEIHAPKINLQAAGLSLWLLSELVK